MIFSAFSSGPGARLYSTLLYSTLLYSTPLYSTLLYSTLLYSTLLYSTPEGADERGLSYNRDTGERTSVRKIMLGGLSYRALGGRGAREL